MFSRAIRLAPIVLIAVAACDQAPTQPDVAPRFKKANATTVVTTLAEWQNAIAAAQPGAIIKIEGTIEIPGGEEIFLTAPDVTIKAETPGSGLRGILNGEGVAPACLVCLSGAADGTTVAKLTLNGVSFTPLFAAVFAADAPLVNVTFTENYVVCSGCGTHVFFAYAPNATFTGNVLTGQPSFSAIQIQQFSTEALVKGNWVEHGGGACGIRVTFESDGANVADNTIESAPRWAICVLGDSDRGKFHENQILEITRSGEASCRDTSSGTGTAGTANKWKHNIAPVPSDPVGICGPDS